MIPDRIERDVFIDAPLEIVWDVVTEAEHVGTWFSNAGAEIDLRPGGAGALTWKQHGTVRLRVEEIDAPRFFSFRWAHPVGEEPRAGNSTLVEFTLEPEGEGTRLRVVELGLQGLEGSEEDRQHFFDDHSEGWDSELTELVAHANAQVQASAR